MSRFPMDDRILWGNEGDWENAGRTLFGGPLPGETDFLSRELGGQTSAMRDDADNLPLSDVRPLKKRRTRAPNDTVDTTIPVDNCFPTDLALRHPVPHLSADRDRDRPIAAPEVDDKLLCGILEVFPDISPQYVQELLAARQTPGSNSKADLVEASTWVKEEIIDQILAQKSYPKQEKAKSKPEQIDDDGKKWEKAAAGRVNDFLYFQDACDVLGQTFPRVPVAHIRQVMSQKKALYAAYLTIYGQEFLSSESDTPYSRLKKPRVNDAGKYYSFRGLEELQAAEREAEKKALALQKREEEEELERRNEEESSQAGTLVECQCCFIDIPLNRAMPCEGETAHFFCSTCIRKSAESQIGLMKWSLQCFDTSGCQETFDRSRLKQTLGPSLMKKLDSLQQEDEIQQACLEGLECCPFCDFKAICGPVEEDREFHCQNPSCEIASCRLCNEESHIPKTCKEARWEKGLPERHTVEEAMSEALIRNCPKCNVKIVKEFGCNRMTCTKCGCQMCYICRKKITKEAYDHFGKAPTFCELHDSHENRHRDEVERAQEEAISNTLSKNSGLTENDLQVYKPTKGKSSVAAPRHKRAAPADLPFERAYHEVRNAHLPQFPQQFRPPFPPHHQRWRPDPAPENVRAFDALMGRGHHEDWKKKDQLHNPPAFVPRAPHPLFAGSMPARPAADRLPPNPHYPYVNY